MVRCLAAMDELPKETVFVAGTKLEACAKNQGKHSNTEVFPDFYFYKRRSIFLF